MNDVLAAGAQKSTTSVKELRNAFSRSRSVASNFGMTIEETTGALAAFANIGLKGEKAGTALKNVFTAIINPGKGMNDVLDELGIKTLKSADGTIHLADVIESSDARAPTTDRSSAPSARSPVPVWSRSSTRDRGRSAI